MAFTGVAVVEQIADNIVRITGVSLEALQTGTIGLNGYGASSGAADIELPAGFVPANYADVSLQDQVKVTFVPITQVQTAIPIRVLKTGTKPLDFLVSMVNDHASLASPQYEIYVEFPPA